MTQNRNVEGLLFDLDGTLLDHDTAAATAFTTALTETAGTGVDHETARRSGFLPSGWPTSATGTTWTPPRRRPPGCTASG